MRFLIVLCAAVVVTDASRAWAAQGPALPARSPAAPAHPKPAPIPAATAAQAKAADPTAAAPAPPPASPGAPAVGPAPGALTRPRVALPEFTVVGGGGSPALGMQLQDGFVLGLFRAGIDVLDPVDVSRRLSSAPELEECETSPCLKRIGQVLGVRFVLRVKVSVDGNSYQMTARLFSTEGPAPAAVPLSTQSRPCNVCTVAEAREQMIRLADTVRPPIEEKPGPPPAPPAAPRTQRSILAPLAGVAAGVTALVAGTVLLLSAPDGDRRQTAVGAGLVGAGVGTSIVSLFFVVDRGPAESATAGARPGIAFGFGGRF